MSGLTFSMIHIQAMAGLLIRLPAEYGNLPCISLSKVRAHIWRCKARLVHWLRKGCYAGGIIGGWKPDQADQAVKVYFSNPDLLFAGEHPAPRLGQGAFAAALKTLVREVCTLPSSLRSLPPILHHSGACC